MKKFLIFIALFLISLGFVGCNLNLTTTVTTSGSTNEVTTSFDTAVTTATDNVSTTIETTTEAIVTTIPTTTEATTTDEYDRYQTINFYSINDFHGGAYSDISMLVNMGAYLQNEKATTDNTIILGNGDIFQGSALSNYYYGLPIVDVFNYVGFDGFVLGNHEFDWGIEQILRYRDGDTENGEMSYPILAANIVYTDSQEPIENTIPYIIKEINGVKVGIIGVIGDVINSISASRVQNITFLDAADTIQDYAAYLRTTEDCDLVVVYAHEGSSLDYEVKDFTGDSYIDAIFNGHTHANESGSISRYSGYPLFYAQASNYETSLFSKISLTYDRVEAEVVGGSAATITYSNVSSYSNSNIQTIIDNYANDTIYVAFVTQVLAHTLYSFNRTDLAPWGASVIRDYAGVDVGALNSGGFRVTMPSGDITMGAMIEIYPFDNYIKTSEMTGQQLLDFYEKVIDRNYDVVFDDGLTYDGSHLYIDGVEVQSASVYTVGAVDYIFDKTYYDFLDGENITQTTYLMRDLLVQDLQNTIGNFNPNLGSSYPLGFDYYDPIYYFELKQSLTIH